MRRHDGAGGSGEYHVENDHTGNAPLSRGLVETRQECRRHLCLVSGFPHVSVGVTHTDSKNDETDLK
jgi:hypothetical protein